MKRNCPVTKNEMYELDITSIGANGEGIGRIDGYTLFVRGAIPGDKINVKVIKAKKSFAIGIIQQLLIPSVDRIEPVCPVANKCGGCSLQHMNYDAQLKYKENLIKESLVRLGGCNKEHIESITEPILGSDTPFYYRNKVQYPVRQNNDKLEIGFFAKGSHRIVETERCYIQDTYNEVIIKTIREFMTNHSITGYNEETQKGLVRHILIRKGYTYNKFHVTLVINGKSLPYVEELTSKLMELENVEAVSLNINTDNTNVILGPLLTTLAGSTYLVDKIGDISYQISPLSFYQVNPVQTVKLYEKALEYADLNGTETVFDLYCGIGTISLFLAKKAKEVYGVEIVDTAIQDAKDNAKLNNIENVYFYTGTSEEVMPRLYHDDGIKADVVVVDPPRKGCDESLLQTIVEMSPEKIVYVSCDPGTLARDVKYLCEHGFKVGRVCGVDMFSQTTHVESVLSMIKEVNQYVGNSDEL